jgi:hypothetical protein
MRCDVEGADKIEIDKPMALSRGRTRIVDHTSLSSPSVGSSSSSTCRSQRCPVNCECRARVGPVGSSLLTPSPSPTGEGHPGGKCTSTSVGVDLQASKRTRCFTKNKNTSFSPPHPPLLNPLRCGCKSHHGREPGFLFFSTLLTLFYFPTTTPFCRSSFSLTTPLSSQPRPNTEIFPPNAYNSL